MQAICKLFKEAFPIKRVRRAKQNIVYYSKMLANLPLFSVNVKIWKLCGFIEFQNYWRSGFLILTAAVMNLFEVLLFVKDWGNFEDLVLSSFMVAILFNSILRIVSVLLNQRQFVEFMQDIVQWLKDAEDQEDIAASKKLKGVASRADFLSKLSLVLGSTGGIMTGIVPIVLNQRELPYPVWIPGIDDRKSPYYEIIFFIQITLTVPFIVVTYIPFTNLFISWLMFGIANLQVLQDKLGNLMNPSKTAEEIDTDLAFCIQYHYKIIRFKDKLNALLSLTNFVEFLIFSLMICVLLFFILITDSFWLQINAAIYILCIFYVVLLFYWHANEFSCESLKIAEAAYNTDWTEGSAKLKKSLLLIIVRSQNALEISAGGIYPMTLETCQSLLSASYSYFTILKGMHQ